MRNLKQYTENYVDLEFEDIQALYRKKKIIEQIEKYPHKHILEIGCGMDPLFNVYNAFDQIVIVEPAKQFSENAINISKRNTILQSKVIVINRLMEEAADALTKFDFDFILVSCLLHEVEDAGLFLKKLHSIMNRETIVHINVPNAYSFHRLLAVEMGLIKSVFEMSEINIRMQQQKVFDLGSLSELVTEHGFKIINSGSYFIKPFTHKQMSEMIKSKILNEKVLDGFYNMTKYLPDFGSEIFVEITTDLYD